MITTDHAWPNLCKIDHQHMILKHARWCVPTTPQHAHWMWKEFNRLGKEKHWDQKIQSCDMYWHLIPTVQCLTTFPCVRVPLFVHLCGDICSEISAPCQTQSPFISDPFTSAELSVEDHYQIFHFWSWTLSPFYPLNNHCCQHIACP